MENWYPEDRNRFTLNFEIVLFTNRYSYFLMIFHGPRVFVRSNTPFFVFFHFNLSFEAVYCIQSCFFILYLSENDTDSCRLMNSILIQATGMFTSEEVTFDGNGRLLNASMKDCKIPTVATVPRRFRVALLKDAATERCVYSSKVRLANLWQTFINIVAREIRENKRNTELWEE